MADKIENIYVKFWDKNSSTWYDVITEDNVISWSFTSSIDANGMYLPGSIANPSVSISGFLTSTFTDNTTYYGYLLTYSIWVYNTADDSLIGSYFIDDIKRKIDGSYTLTAYMTDTNNHASSITLASSNTNAYDLLNSKFTISNLADILPTSTTSDMSTATAPINPLIYTSAYTITYNTLLKMLGCYTGLSFECISTAEAAVRGSVKYKAFYPKRTGVIISANESDVTTDDDGNYVFPMFEADISYSDTKCFYPRQLFFYFWKYASSAWSTDYFMAQISSQYENTKQITVDVESAVWIYDTNGSTVINSANRAWFNFTNLLYGEITNRTGAVPTRGKVTNNVHASDVYYPISFRTVSNTILHIGDIITIKTGRNGSTGKTFETIITSITTNANGTTVECEGSNGTLSLP